MHIKHNISLLPYNTFGINVLAKSFITYTSTAELQEAVDHYNTNNEKKLLVLGGGSNVLFTQNYDGLVLKNDTQGMQVMHITDTQVTLTVQAGVQWHELVLYCVAQGWGGIENLALIPGTVGAAPIQNIGAYGVEVKDTIVHVTALHIPTGELHNFPNCDCAFGYRTSIFKTTYKQKYIITQVTFVLQLYPKYNIQYGAIQAQLQAMQCTAVNLQAICNAVVAIRNSKLPNPKVIGNAGSFFKNPTVTLQEYDKLLLQFPKIVGYTNTHNNTVKLAAAWLIEYCGYKGYRQGNAGNHHAQALVLVNYGGATGAQVLAVSELITNAVYAIFKVLLEKEVNIL